MRILKIKEGDYIDFLSLRKIASLISLILILSGIVSISYHNGLKYGIDFKGGTNVQIQFTKTPDLDKIRDIFSKRDMKNIILQTFGDISNKEILLGLPINSPLGTGEK